MYSNLVKAPDTLGQIVMTGDAAIVQSSGDLENNEEVAQTVFRMIHCASRDDILPKECSGSGDGIKRMCVYLQNYYITVILNQQRIHIIKRKYAHQSDGGP
ncbi:ragulator complex protein LAMTOR4-like isoform X2 [Varroa jacobsoni]|uniref:Late endosomal/lysosomal adaptor and MAPK and MTOR activator 4 n=1 Tax=Varroa destructor TaxID=109461 RepID=A0A7M7MJJ1_VARDE|nr:ragulator complex protein LAMTOR4-like [Varroa destructor]XP_022671445.1 ragulator complex protein LAMTOR4-like [Varroa destructor]XP_022687692.1 ragulator complex protein LAMTOR4-like isoform X2 [Varroa jacobsoni]